jgi:hypothetical protein
METMNSKEYIKIISSLDTALTISLHRYMQLDSKKNREKALRILSTK